MLRRLRAPRGDRRAAPPVRVRLGAINSRSSRARSSLSTNASQRSGTARGRAGASARSRRRSAASRARGPAGSRRRSARCPAEAARRLARDRREVQDRRLHAHVVAAIAPAQASTRCVRCSPTPQVCSVVVCSAGRITAARARSGRAPAAPRSPPRTPRVTISVALAEARRLQRAVEGAAARVAASRRSARRRSRARRSCSRTAADTALLRTRVWHDCSSATRPERGLQLARHGARIPNRMTAPRLLCFGRGPMTRRRQPARMQRTGSLRSRSRRRRWRSSSRCARPAPARRPAAPRGSRTGADARSSYPRRRAPGHPRPPRAPPAAARASDT